MSHRAVTFLQVGTLIVSRRSPIGKEDEEEVSGRFPAISGGSHSRLVEDLRNGNGGDKNKMIRNVCTHITSKQIKLESSGWSGLVGF